MKGCADRQRKRAAAPGRVQSHRRMEGGGGKGKNFKALIYQSYKSRLVTTNINHSNRKTDLGTLQFFIVLLV